MALPLPGALVMHVYRQSMTTFGPEPGEGDGDESAPSGDLGDGHFIKINEDVWRGLLHHPSVVTAITARANAIAETANSLVAMDPRAVARLGQGKPAYTTELRNDPHASRARVRVLPNPETMLGVIDDAHHSTLLKSVAAFPSDPFPEVAEISEDAGMTEPPGRMTGPGFDEVE